MLGMSDLPMTTYEYNRMLSLEAGGMEHEKAKQQIYTERGASGNPVVAAPSGTQPTATYVAIPATNMGFVTKAALWWDRQPYWTKLALGMGAGAIGGVFALFYRHQGKKAAIQEMVDVIKGVEAGSEQTGIY